MSPRPRIYITDFITDDLAVEKSILGDLGEVVALGAVQCATARQRGIPVSNVPDYGTEASADTAIAMTLALARGTHLLNSRLRAGQGAWTYTQAVPVYSLRGRIFGSIGLGSIGTAAVHRTKALGMKVVFFDPYVPDGWERVHGISRAETLDDLLPQAHVLSLHCPATPETIGLIRTEQISPLPRRAFLINIARGAIVHTAAI